MRALRLDRGWRRGLLAALIVAAPAAWSTGDPCTGVKRILRPEERAAIQASVADLLQTHRATVADYMAAEGWVALWVDAPDEETSVFFFHGDPRETAFTGVWGGSGAPGAESANAAWARAYVPGIPESLASCFAWRVSPEGMDVAAQRGKAPAKQAPR